MNIIRLIFPPKPYLANLHTKEVHDTRQAKKQCSINLMAEHNKKYLTERGLQKALKNGFNGCIHCLKKHSTR